MILGSQSVLVLTAGTITDDYHNVMLDWLNASSVLVRGCSVQPGVGGQDVTNREAVTTLYTAWLPLTTLVSDTNRIGYSGTIYDIDGQVERWEVGDALDHLVVRLKAVTG